MSPLSRRQFLVAGGAAAGLTAAAASGVAIARNDANASSEMPARGGEAPIVPFRGVHQAGIATPQQEHAVVAAFDLGARDRSELVALLRSWTAAASALTAADALEHDSGDAAGLGAARLTLTFGFGATLFRSGRTDRYGVASARPDPLVDMPAFKGDDLDLTRSDGDMCVQACADDPHVAHHAIRNLARIGSGTAVLRWLQTGFAATASGDASETPRNLMGFKDGTNNLRPGTAQFDTSVWAQPADDPAWMRGGTYMVLRRIRMHLEKWDRSNVAEQERTIGRHKESGAPLGARGEHDPVVVANLPAESHVALADQRKNGVSILRRGYTFGDGVDPRTGQLDAGLLFIAFQRDPRVQFLPLQRKLAQLDELNKYVFATASGIYAVPPGVTSRDGFVGETLFS